MLPNAHLSKHTCDWCGKDITEVSERVRCVLVSGSLREGGGRPRKEEKPSDSIWTRRQRSRTCCVVAYVSFKHASESGTGTTMAAREREE